MIGWATDDCQIAKGTLELAECTKRLLYLATFPWSREAECYQDLWLRIPQWVRARQKLFRNIKLEYNFSRTHEKLFDIGDLESRSWWSVKRFQQLSLVTLRDKMHKITVSQLIIFDWASANILQFLEPIHCQNAIWKHHLFVINFKKINLFVISSKKYIKPIFLPCSGRSFVFSLKNGIIELNSVFKSNKRLGSILDKRFWIFYWKFAKQRNDWFSREIFWNEWKVWKWLLWLMMKFENFW